MRTRLSARPGDQPRFRAEVRSVNGCIVRAELSRGDSRKLGAKLGERLLATADHETLAADIVAIGNGGLLELRLVDTIEPTQTIELRRPPIGGAR